MSDDDLQRPPLPLGLVALGVLVVIGLFTMAGWLAGAAWSLVRVGLLVTAVMAVVWAARTLRR